MANCQNNMRYGRQMNFNGTYRAMPGNDQSCRKPESCGRPLPEPCVPKPCDCRKPDPCEADPCIPPSWNRRKPDPCESRPCPRTTPECRESKPCSAPVSEHYEPKCMMPKHKMQKPCHCPHDALQDLPIAMAYVPWQRWQNLYEHCKGFQRGTIFEDLTKPFYGRGGCNR